MGLHAYDDGDDAGQIDGDAAFARHETSRISTATNIVFHYRDSAVREDKDTLLRRCPKPRLFFVLLGIYLPLSITLSTLMIVLWYRENMALWRLSGRQHQHQLAHLTTTWSASFDGLAVQLHARMSQSAKTVLTQYLSAASRAVELDDAMMQPQLGLITADKLGRDARYLLTQLRLQRNLTAVCYTDHSGVYIGYSRHVLDDPEGSVRFEYRPRDDGNATSKLLCPVMCPPPELATPGRFYEYLVSSGADRPSAWDPVRVSPLNPQVRPWYKAAVAARGHLTWVKPHLLMDRSGGAGVLGATVAKAQPKPGELLIASVDITLNGISELISRIEPPRGSRRIFVIDRDGMMIASSGGMEEVALDSPDGVPQQLPWQNLSGVIPLAVQDLISKHGSLQALSSSDSSHVFRAHGQRFVIARWVVLIGQVASAHLEWIVVSVQPIRDYTRAARAAWEREHEKLQVEQTKILQQRSRATLITMLWCAVLLFVGLVAMGLITRAIVVPLRHVAKNMRAILNWELDGLDAMLQEGRRQILPIHEISSIYDSFTYMVTGLRSLSSYMDPYVAQTILQSKLPARLGMAKTEVTVFFSDIVNFTSIAEDLDPVTFMELLATYLEEMSGIIQARGGTVGEFIGDSVMAWWNAPRTLTDHTAIAMYAALEQQARLRELREQWCKRGLPEVKARMGLVCGQVLAGNVGSKTRMKYGLVGDSVNLASRLDSLCQHYGVGVLVDDAACGMPGVQSRFFARPLDLVVVKGRANKTELFELVACKGPLVGTPMYREHESFCEDFRAVQGLYRERRFCEASEALKVYQARWPADAPAEILRRRCVDLAASELADDWSPTERFKHK